jgi:hypothetical protein
MASVEDQLARLPAMSRDELRAAWRRLVSDAPCPRLSVSLLRLAVAWQLQARAHGGLSRATTTRLDQLGAGKTRTEQPRAGMRLVRSWNGVAHVVTVDEAGVIHWSGKEWRSLSEVARAITGTRWSGPAFFGLKKKVAA